MYDISSFVHCPKCWSSTPTPEDLDGDEPIIVTCSACKVAIKITVELEEPEDD